MIKKQYTSLAVSIDTRSEEQIENEKRRQLECRAILAGFMPGVVFTPCYSWRSIPIDTNNSRITKRFSFQEIK